MKAYKALLTELEDAILTITLNRPESLNAFDDTMSFELLDCLKAAEKDTAVRCIVITGAGRGFCTGQDLKSRTIQLQDNADANAPKTTPHLGDSIRLRYSPIILKITTLEKPVIAKINGVAAGAGASLALACDFRVASTSASFLQAFVKVGLIPDSGAAWFLPRLIGLGKAMELAMLGDKIPAEAAHSAGLFHRCVTPEALDAETHTLALQLAQSPTRALGLMKRAFHKAISSDLETYLAHEADLQELAGRTNDYQEGLAAFTQKRPAAFLGK